MEPAGIEPATSCLQTLCLATAPLFEVAGDDASEGCPRPLPASLPIEEAGHCKGKT